MTLASNEKLPFICELAGMPRAGKTSTIGALRNRLEEQGLSVRVIDEGIRESPLRGAGLGVLNAAVWHQKVSQLLSLRYTAGADVVLVDRGPFDAIALSYLLEARGNFTSTIARAWRRLLREELWQVDQVFLLIADPYVSLQRDGRTHSEGTVMNLPTLKQWRIIYERTMAMLVRGAPLLAGTICQLDTGGLTSDAVQQWVMDQVVPSVSLLKAA